MPTRSGRRYTVNKESDSETSDVCTKKDNKMKSKKRGNLEELKEDDTIEEPPKKKLKQSSKKVEIPALPQKEKKGNVVIPPLPSRRSNLRRTRTSIPDPILPNNNESQIMELSDSDSENENNDSDISDASLYQPLSQRIKSRVSQSRSNSSQDSNGKKTKSKSKSKTKTESSSNSGSKTGKRRTRTKSKSKSKAKTKTKMDSRKDSDSWSGESSTKTKTKTKTKSKTKSKSKPKMSKSKTVTNELEILMIGDSDSDDDDGMSKTKSKGKGKGKGKGKKKEVEKRLARFRATCSQKTRDRIDRAMYQRLFMVNAQILNEYSRKYAVLGSTGNVYYVTIGSLNECTCPDFMKGNLCKHVLFVMLKVLRVGRHSQYVYQKALLKSELKEIFEKAPNTLFGVLANDNVRSKYATITGDAINEKNVKENNVKRKEIDGDCAICMEEMVDGKKGREHELVWCQGQCGQNIHKQCFNEWAKNQRNSDEDVTCPYCRTRWINTDDFKNSKNESRCNYSSNNYNNNVNEGYLNFGNEQGQDRYRDTSSYNEWGYSRWRGRSRWSWY